jgi:hypothetical protein
MRVHLLFCLLASIASPSLAQQTVSPTAEAIMARVAANQDRSELERTHYIYVQHGHTISRKGKTIRCEETTDYRITPTKEGSAQTLLALDGRLLRKGKYIHYTSLEPDKSETSDKKDPQDKTPAKQDADEHPSLRAVAAAEDDDDTMDRDLVENMRKNLTAGKSKDGIGADLFPLTSKTQADYQFRMLGRELKNGRDCFHVAFAPKDKNDYGWKGDAWIDTTAYEPVVIRTAMAKNIPLAVRMLLGTSVPGLGFTIIYTPQTSDNKEEPAKPDNVWFPVSFGTEFKLNVLFFIHRTIVLDVQNRDFEKTHVSSTIVEKPDASTQP